MGYLGKPGEWLWILAIPGVVGCALLPTASTESLPEEVAPFRSETARSALRIKPISIQPEELPAPDAPPKPAEPLPPPPRVRVGDGGLTLDQAINACLLNDPKLRAGFEAINQAHADALSASLRPNPTFFTDIQLLPLTRPFTPTRQGGPPQQDFIVGIPIDWFVFGKQAAAMASAGVGIRVSEAEYADLIRRRVLEVALAYYDVLEVRELLIVAEQDVQSSERVEATIRKGVDAGGRPQVELTRVRLDLLRSRQVLRQAGATEVAAKARLRSLLGQMGEDPTFEVQGSLAAPPLGGPLSVDEAYALAMLNRPDLEAQRWRISQAQSNTELERRKGYPQLTPSFGYTRQYQTSIGFPDADTWSASLQMSLPFYDRNQGNVMKAASQVAQNERELEAGEIALHAEIVGVVQEFQTAQANAGSVGREQLQLAADARDAIIKAYEEAQGRSLLDVLDAQRNYRDTYRLYIASRAAYWRAVSKFNSAVGQQVVPRE